MSKTASKNPPPLSTKSAWSRGPPTPIGNSPRAPSPAQPFHPTHSRRPSSNLAIGVPIKDGVSVPRNNLNAVKESPSVTFGSINDASAQMSSSPAPVQALPATRPEGVKSFGTVPATNHDSNGVGVGPSSKSSLPPSASSTPPLKPKFDASSLFRGAASASNPSSNPASPSIRPAANLPPPLQHSNSSSSSTQSSSPFIAPAFVPRQHQNAPPMQAPRSPAPYARMQNGNNQGQRQPGPGTPGGPHGMPAGLSSPRLGHHPPSGQPSGLPPLPPPSQPQQWAPYFYPGMPVDGQGFVYSQQGWYPATYVIPPPQQGMPPPPHPSQQQQLPPPPNATLSPRNPQMGLPLQAQQQQQQMMAPGTPQQTHAMLAGHPMGMVGGPGPPPTGGPMMVPHPHQHHQQHQQHQHHPHAHQGPSPPQPSLPHPHPGLHHHHHQQPHPAHQTQQQQQPVQPTAAAAISPPQTPLSANVALGGGGAPASAGGRLKVSASAFVPGGAARLSARVTIKNGEGQEIELDKLKSAAPPVAAGPNGSGVGAGAGPLAGPGFVPASMAGNRKSVIRIESEEERERRVKDEKEREEREREEVERTKREEEERIEREKREAEEKVRKANEEEERRKAEEEESKRRLEEEERVRKEKEEEERVKKEKEEEERVEAAAAAAKAKAEAEAEEEAKAKAKAEEEAAAAAKAKEEADAKAKEEADAKAKEEAQAKEKKEAEAEAMAKEEADAKTKEDAIEPGEIVEEVEEVNPISASVATTSTSAPVSDHPPTAPKALRIDTAAAENGLNGGAAPANVVKKLRPGPLQLHGLNDMKGIPPSLPSALATARIIDDLDSVRYPEGVMSPNPELNAGAKDGKFRYDRDFLLQFMSICKEKPDSLPPLDAIGLEPTEQAYSMARGGSGRHRQPSGSAPPSSRNPPAGFGPGGVGFGKPGAPPFAGGMGNFGTSKLASTSEERFAMSNAAGRTVSVSGAGPAGVAFPGVRPSPMVRSTSQGGPGNNPNARTRSKRGTPRPAVGADGGKGGPSSAGPGGPGSGGFGGIMGSGLEPVQPLVQSQDRWVAGSAGRKGAAAPANAAEESVDLVDKKVKSLLNKLSMEKFESISDQIIAWANKSEKEKDGRTLIQVIRLVFEKATDEATWSEMYARLCRKMMEQISPEVQDDGIKNAEGKPIAGGQLFRKYLLNRCQEDFERGWVAKEAAAAAAATKAKQDEATKAANEEASGKKDGGDGEVALYSNEYYVAQKAKRQGLGLIKFIGELFKLQMLTERIMHECVKKLLGNVENPEEEEIESLCKLLATVGSALDTPKARAHMDVYFSRMRELTKSQNVSSRMQYMLQDVIELRDRKWVTRNLVAAPTTLAQVHETAAKEKALQQEREQMQRQMSMSRGGSRRGGERSEVPQQDGWSVAGGSSPAVTRPLARIGDLSNFGKINKASAPMSFGPSGVFAGKKDSAANAIKREALPRTSSNGNMFLMLSQAGEVPTGDAGKSRGPSRKSSVDLGNGAGAIEPAVPRQRRKLMMAPKSKPVEELSASALSGSAEPESGEVSEEEAGMSEEDAKKKIENDIKEFFAVRNLEEADNYFEVLPSDHHPLLVEKFVGTAIEGKSSDSQLVASFFDRIVKNGRALCSAASFDAGFLSVAEFLDDIAIDAPKAFENMATILGGAGYAEDEARLKPIADKSMDGDKLLALVAKS